MSQTPSKHSRKYSGILWRLLNYYRKITKEFLRSTLINGLKYLTFKYLTLWEKLFFLCCFIAILYSSLDFAENVMKKWQRFPVLTSINPQTSDITKEPFPAITICNVNQVQYSKVKDFDKNSWEYAMQQKICSQKMNFTAFAQRQQQRSANISFDSFIVKNGQSCSDMIVLCNYGNVKRTCSDLFREVLLDEGLCCSFNVVHPYMLHKGFYLIVQDYTTFDGASMPLNWSLGRGYPKELPASFYPRMPSGTGISNGFTIILNGDLDNYYCSSTNGAGFKVSFHNPVDTPNVKEIGLTVPLGYQSSFRITTFKEEADNDLRTSTKPIERQCYFDDEYPLRYFRYYTRLNCEMECGAEFMQRKCNCLDFHMPVVTDNYVDCLVKDFDCVDEIEHGPADEILSACRKKCLPDCKELYYHAKVFFTELNNKGFRIRDPFLRNISKESLNNYAVLQIFFPEKYYRGTVKNPYTGFTEFLSQVGGIMGLMMGFSVISFVEMAYFFVIKPLVCAWRTHFGKNIIAVTKINLPEDGEMRKYQKPESAHRYSAAPPNMFAKEHLPPSSKNIE